MIKVTRQTWSCDKCKLTSIDMESADKIPEGWKMVSITDHRGAVTTVVICNSPNCEFDGISFSNSMAKAKMIPPITGLADTTPETGDAS